jgi:hypothetical protein
MSMEAKVLGDWTIGGEKLLSVAGGLKPLHAPLPLTSGLMGVFCTVLEIPMLAMFHTREELALGSPVALEFICDDDTRSVG